MQIIQKFNNWKEKKTQKAMNKLYNPNDKQGTIQCN